MDKPPSMYEQKSPVRLSLMDRAISFLSPKAGLYRIQSKMALHTYKAMGYVVPGKYGKRSMQGWFTQGNSANVDTLTDINKAREGSRDLAMNTPIAIGALERMVTNVVGPGLSLQSRIDRKFLGLSNEAATKWEKDVERRWALFNRKEQCDITRTNTFKQLQALAFYSYLLSGDVFVLFTNKKFINSYSNLKLQLIESDQISNPSNSGLIEHNLKNGNKVYDGIEVDKNGTPVAIYVSDKHPGDELVTFKWKRIEIFGKNSGRQNILHVYDKKRPGQNRGMPFLSVVLEKIKQVSRLSESELMAALVTSFFTVFIKNVDRGRFDEGFLMPGDTTGESQADTLTEDPTTDKGKQKYELGPASIVQLNKNEEADIADPKRPNAAFEPFFQGLLKEIGCGIGIPFEVLLQIFQNNYSASRAAVLEAVKTFNVYISNFNSNFNQPAYEAFLLQEVLDKHIQAPGFLTDLLVREAWCGSRWNGAGQGQIDPKKETEAALLRIKGKLSTHEDEAQKIGQENWERVVERRAREEEILKENNLQNDDVSNEELTNKESDKDLEDE